jgi:hypothetical protein
MLTMKSGGSSEILLVAILLVAFLSAAMFAATGREWRAATTACEGCAAPRWTVTALAHLASAEQETPRVLLTWDAVVSGRSGIVTAQPASSAVAAIAAVSFTILQLEDSLGRECSM